MRDLPQPPADEKAARRDAANAKRSASQRSRFEKHPELREAARERARSINTTPEMRTKISDATRQAMARPDVRQKTLANSSPERKALISRRTREAMADPEVRKRISERTREAMARPEVRARIAEGLLGGAPAPDRLARDLAALRAVWAATGAHAQQAFRDEIIAALPPKDEIS